MANKPLPIQIDYTLVSMIFTAKNAVSNTLGYVQQHYRNKDKDHKIYNAYGEIAKLLDKYEELINALILEANKEDE